MSDRKIIESIQRLSGVQLSDKCYLAKGEVESYDIPSRTAVVTLIDGEKQVEKTISLCPDVDDSIIILPTVGTNIWVVWSDYVPPFMAGFPSAFDKIIFGKQDAGLPLTPEIVQRVNLIEEKVNQIINTFNAHVHTGVQTGSGSSAITPTQVSGTLDLTTNDNIESKTLFQ